MSSTDTGSHRQKWRPSWHRPSVGWSRSERSAPSSKGSRRTSRRRRGEVRIEQMRRDYPVPPMCRVPGVPVSGHHVWRKRKSPERTWQEPRPGSGGAHGPPANPGKFQAGAPAATSGGTWRANRLAPGQEAAQKIRIALQAEAPDQGHDEFEARPACRVESAEPGCLGDDAQSRLVW